MMNNIEFRSGSIGLNDQETKKIGGVAIVAETRSELLCGEFYEIISRSALDNVIEKNDIKLYLNHQPEKGTVARSKYGKGSLKLTVTERGLEFETICPNTPLGQELYEGLAREDYDKCSFGFRVAEDHWDKNDDGTYTRTILSFDMVDELSVLSCRPAYASTECALRSLEEFKKSETETRDEEEETKSEQEKIEEGKSEADAKQKEEEELKQYYADLKKDFQ